ncbi:sorting nexin-7 isoform X2 [Boleophthalmus pectinirostris]|uniref:sorting nexin-7 isoform X2 n=1 Tax=Boleophthalmus pectinirostris TaxID=150288 RepID=UPI000A1C69D6|nr:sorting nexin-7 isoform X2 [Boleophthalmus pectinirostris]
MAVQGTTADLSVPVLDLEEDDDLEVFSKTSVADGNPLPTSPSSMTNQYHLDHEDPEESLEKNPEQRERDLFITVDNPESHVTAIETFIIYRVLTRTTRGDFDSSEVEVRRRYQEFSWLRSKLEESHPTLIVPPLPEKFVMKGMVERFNDDFIETRKRALHRFLQKISVHPVLSHSPHLKAFLTAQDLTPHKKGPGLLSRMGDTVRSMAQSVRGVRGRAEEFNSLQDYSERFSSTISSVDRVTQRVIREQREYLDELRQYSPTYSQWAELEEGLSEPLKGMARSLELIGQETEAQSQELSEVLEPVLHEYVLCADTVKTVLRRRDNIQADFEVKNETLTTKKVEQDTLQEEVDALADRLEQANVALRADWKHWRSNLRTDVREALVSTAERNVQYYEKCLAIWESFLLSQKVDPAQHQNLEPSS